MHLIVRKEKIEVMKRKPSLLSFIVFVNTPLVQELNQTTSPSFRSLKRKYSLAVVSSAETSTRNAVCFMQVGR
jgi:hypothetical protein